MEASFWGLDFDAPEQSAFERRDDVAVVEITGPLTHHSDWWWDSYDSIRERVLSAIESSCKVVVLKIDSPGGDVSGCFELSRDLRAMSETAGKRLVAYADGMAASAAYAIACAANEIYVPETGYVGSVGVIAVKVDQVEYDKQMGMNFAVVASGKRKADGCPHVPLNEESLLESQSQVDSLASIFFDLVAESRGMSADSVRSLEAGLFHGKRAVEAGLANGVVSFEKLLATVASEKPVASSRGAEGKMDFEEMVSALKKMAEGDGDEADKAKRALKALEDEPETDKAEDESEPAKEDEDDEKKEEEEPSASSNVRVIQLLESSAAERKAEKEAREKAAIAEERARLITGHVILNKDVKAWLEDPKTSIQSVRDACRALPTASAPENPAAAATVQATRGESQGTGAGALDQKTTDMLDSRMGIRSTRKALRSEDGRRVQILGAIDAKERAEIMARRASRKAGE
jgi:signal peptide peptidase SppA